MGLVYEGWCLAEFRWCSDVSFLWRHVVCGLCLAMYVCCGVRMRILMLGAVYMHAYARGLLRLRFCSLVGV